MNRKELLEVLTRFQGGWTVYTAGMMQDTAEVLASKHAGNVPFDVVAETLRYYTPAALRPEMEAFISQEAR